MTDVRNLSDGQEVQVWSNSQRSWIDGKVLKKENRVPDGLVVLVEYGNPPRQKWLTAAMVPQKIRVTAKVQKAKVQKAGRALCKHGCGRCVQPGLTRGLQPYDTCCKACAVTKGGGRHDKNCEGGGDATPIRAAVPGRNPRHYLESLRLDPTHEDAKSNLRKVRGLLQTKKAP